MLRSYGNILMILFNPKCKKRKNLKLLGAVQIRDTSFLVCKNQEGNIRLEDGEKENLQKKLLKGMISLNPRIKKILNSFKIKPIINTKALRELSGGHMNDTCKIAMGIYSHLSDTVKNLVDINTLKEASMLHDMGKALIPSKILNKPTKLNRKERKIMNIHSTLGYELLKTQEISQDTLELIKYHHQNLKHSGYPLIISDDKISDIGVQIISTADKYSALREKRVYRKRLNRAEALLILYKEVLEGKIHREIYKALFEYASKYDRAA